MAKANSWETVTVLRITVKKVIIESESEDIWKVDRFPTKQTKSFKVSYSMQKAIKRYGKK